jgi:hypothetical protein
LAGEDPAPTKNETESGRLLEQGRELQKTARSLLISRPRWLVSRRFIVDSFQTLTAGSLIPKGMPLHVLSVFFDMRKKTTPTRRDTMFLNARWKKTEKENKNLEVGKVGNNTPKGTSAFTSRTGF